MNHRVFVEKLYDVRNEPDKLNALIMREHSTLPTDPMTLVDDGLLWQEIYSLREKIKIAVSAIKHYDPNFDDQEFTHQINSVDYDQLMEELSAHDEPRTCETCGDAKVLAARILANAKPHTWVDQIYEYAEQIEAYAASRAPQSSDVEMVRGSLKKLAYPTIIRCKPARVINLDDALAALDRISGKEKG